MKKNNELRNYNIDTLKFICMFAIIIIHLTGKGGLVNNSSNNVFINNFYRILNNVLIIAVNVFCIITGYLYAEKKKINNKNIVGIIFNMFFYSIIITGIFYLLNLFNIREYGFKYILDSIFPSRIGRYWFITSYIFLFFLIPFLNILINKIKENNYKKLIIIIFIFICFLQEILMYDIFKTNWGYSTFWLIYLYLLGAYEKKYRININDKKALTMLITLIFINIIEILLTQNILSPSNLYYYLGEHYTSPTIVISSFLFFHLFLKSKNNETIFSKLGKYSLAVIIIHGHRLIYDLILNQRMIFILKYNLAIQILLLFLIALTIYVLCVFIEKIKNRIYSFFRIKIIMEKIGNKLNEVLT